METAWYALRQNKLDDKHLSEMKINLIKRLIKAGVNREKIESLLFFILPYIEFANPKQDAIFELEKSNLLDEPNFSNMTLKEYYIQTVVEDAIEEREELAFEQGIEQGEENRCS